jgi:hypothetical protein
MVKRTRLRRPGSPWRVKADAWEGGRYGVSYHVASDSTFGGGDGKDSEWSKHVELPGTEFDELVVGRWLHVEQQDTSVYWMDVGGVTINVRVDRDGRPKAVDVYGPGDYAEPVEGVAYSLAWTEEGEDDQ